MNETSHAPTLIDITVDHRESKTPVLPLLRERTECRVQLAHLKAGDYAIGSSLLLERKTIHDLVISIMDGRLFSQAQRLSTSGARGILIVEGHAAELSNHGMTWEAIQGALVTVAVFYGVPVLWSRDAQGTVNTMLFAAQQARTHAAGALPRYGYRPRGKRARQLYILQSLPMVGPLRARRLLDRFGSVRAVMRAAIEELNAVEGIGTGVAKAIIRVVEEPAARYRVAAPVHGKGRDAIPQCLAERRKLCADEKFELRLPARRNRRTRPSPSHL
jgi:DNA excision repair protein ERCC-4